MEENTFVFLSVCDLLDPTCTPVILFLWRSPRWSRAPDPLRVPLILDKYGS